MTADDVRGELAAALDAHEPTWNEIYDEMRCVCGADLYPDGIDAHRAEALLPVVDRIAKERAAEEIRAIAHRLDDGGDEAIEVALGGASYVHRVLCDCAHALDGKP